MIVLSLTNCPNALRGELSRWFFEVDTNLFVGKHSARVRDKIWERVTSNAKSGQAVMVYPKNNEQGFDFRVWGSKWYPVDLDGLNLMLRPHQSMSLSEANLLKRGDSKVEKRLAAKRFASFSKLLPALPETYLVVDIETTGLVVGANEIIEIGAIKVTERKPTDYFQAIIRVEALIPPEIEELTGISNQIIATEGQDLGDALSAFAMLAGEFPLVSHNADFRGQQTHALTLLG